MTSPVAVGANPTLAALLQDGTGGGALSFSRTTTGTIAVTSNLDLTLTNPLSTYTGVTTVSGGGLNDTANFSQRRFQPVRNFK